MPATTYDADDILERTENALDDSHSITTRYEVAAATGSGSIRVYVDNLAGYPHLLDALYKYGLGISSIETNTDIVGSRNEVIDYDLVIYVRPLQQTNNHPDTPGPTIERKQ